MHLCRLGRLRCGLWLFFVFLCATVFVVDISLSSQAHGGELVVWGAGAGAGAGTGAGAGVCGVSCCPPGRTLFDVVMSGWGVGVWAPSELLLAGCGPLMMCAWAPLLQQCGGDHGGVGFGH